MPLNKANAEKLQAWLQEKCLLFVCAGCGQRQWNADEMIGSLMMGNGGHVNIARAELAGFIPLTCLNCGYTVLFSATVIGIAPKGSRP